MKPEEALSEILTALLGYEVEVVLRSKEKAFWDEERHAISKSFEHSVHSTTTYPPILPRRAQS